MVIYPMNKGKTTNNHFRIEEKIMPKYKTFTAHAQMRDHDYEIEVTMINLDMAICHTDGPIYITKSQAMEFFDLIEKPRNLPAIDDVIFVSDLKDCSFSIPRHFSHYDKDGGIWCFTDGRSKRTANEQTEKWMYWKMEK